MGVGVEEEVANGKKVISQSTRADEVDQKSWVSETVAVEVGSSFEIPLKRPISRLREGRLEEEAAQMHVTKPITIDEGISTPGFMKSLNGSERERPNINLEVVIGEAQQMMAGVGPSVVPIPSCNLSAHASNFLSNCMAQGRNNGDGSGSSQGSFVSSSIRMQSGGTGGRRLGKRRLNRKGYPYLTLFHRGAIFRAAATAISQSLSQKSQASRLSRRRRKLLEEAQGTITLGKSLGINFEGKESEVMSKLVDLEVRDAQRVAGVDPGLVDGST